MQVLLCVHNDGVSEFELYRKNIYGMPCFVKLGVELHVHYI